MAKLLHLIVACAENRVIGRAGKLPWHIPEDQKFFHDETAGQIDGLKRLYEAHGMIVTGPPLDVAEVE